MEFSRRYHLNVIKELCIKCRWMLLLYLLLPWIPSGVAQIVWREIPQNVTINLDETVEIPCRIDIDTLPAGTGIMWSFRETASSTTINLVVGSRTSSVRLANRPHLSTNPNNVSTGRYNLRITGASLDDDGIYNCEILGDVRSGQIIVQVPPRTPDAITTNSSSSSSSLVFQENSGLSLTCVSRGGNPPPDFLWLKNGEILLNPNVETSPSKLKGNNSVSVLSLRLDWKDDTAQYTCRVWNIANRDTPVEASITLSVQYVPQITFDDYPVKQNGSVRWPCDVQANPAPSIQWEKTGQPSFSVSGEVLELTNVQRSASGEYSCIASNNLGETTRRATLDVQYAPIITLPVSVVVNESSSLNITCYYDANPVPFSIQWSKSNRLVSTTIYDQSLTWNQISRSDRGVYSCSVRNRLSTFDVLDSTAEVTVSVRYPPGPASISGSSGESVNRNETFTLTCQADDPGYPHAFFRWFKVNKSKKDLIFVGPIYTKTNVQYADAGRYECEPSNMMGLGTSVSVAVVVNVPPSIVESSPAEISISTTVKDFSLNCSSIARPQPRILWFWNGQRITRTDLYQTNSSFTQQDEGRFLVTSWLHFRGFSRTHMKDGYPSLIRKEDFGNYTCQAASAHHPVAKHTMFLKVLYAPDILKIARFGRIGIDIGSNPYITCEGDAYPEITLRWFLQGQELSNNNKYHIELGLGNGFNMVKKVLTIQNFADSDYAVYECIGLNRLGQATENVTLVRKSTPEAPTNLQNVSMATTSVMLRWFVGFNGGHHQAFFVNIRNVNADIVEQRKVAGVITSGLTVIFNVTDLLPGTLYTFQVTATNELGTSPVSAPLTLTLPGSPTEGETQDDGADGGLTMNEVIIVACVCSLIVVALLIILIVVIIRRKREQPQTTQAKDYESETNRGRPQPINGASRSPNKKQATTTLGYDNPGAVELKHNNGNVINGRPGYQAPPNNVRLNGSSPHDILYDSHETPHINYSDENERHIHIHGQFDDQPPPYNYTNLAYTDHPDDPTSPPKDHIDLNLNGMESGYSTPEPSKPKKIHISQLTKILRQRKGVIYYADLAPFAHDPPGHTSGLPCCYQGELDNSSVPTKFVHIQQCSATMPLNCTTNFTLGRKSKSLLQGRPMFTDGNFSLRPLKVKDASNRPALALLMDFKRQSQELENGINNLAYYEENALTLNSSMYSLRLQDFAVGESADDFIPIETGEPLTAYCSSIPVFQLRPPVITTEPTPEQMAKSLLMETKKEKKGKGLFSKKVDKRNFEVEVECFNEPAVYSIAHQMPDLITAVNESLFNNRLNTNKTKAKIRECKKVRKRANMKRSISINNLRSIHCSDSDSDASSLHYYSRLPSDSEMQPDSQEVQSSTIPRMSKRRAIKPPKVLPKPKREFPGQHTGTLIRNSVGVGASRENITYANNNDFPPPPDPLILKIDLSGQNSAQILIDNEALDADDYVKPGFYPTLKGDTLYTDDCGNPIYDDAGAYIACDWSPYMFTVKHHRVDDQSDDYDASVSNESSNISNTSVLNLSDLKGDNHPGVKSVITKPGILKHSISGSSLCTIKGEKSPDTHSLPDSELDYCLNPIDENYQNLMDSPITLIL